MTFQHFRRLISAGERKNIDFKAACNAFNRSAGDHVKAKAELVKDICAMANNGPDASYLIIGVANDGKKFHSVLDPNLTPANIQTLLRDSIHPRPFVRVHQCCWPRAPKPFAGVRFVVIQVGPNPKTAFRFAKDYIEDGSKFCFRKHQVWVRNDDTSDLATPEQVVALATRRLIVELQHDFKARAYSKLPCSEQLPALQQDLRLIFKELGYKTTPAPNFKKPGFNPPPDEFRVSVPIRRRTFVFRCCLRQSLTKRYLQSVELCKSWNLEHGLLFFLTGTLGKVAKLDPVHVDFDAHWGNLCSSRLQAAHTPWSSPNVPTGFPDLLLPIITLPKISDTRTLRQKLTDAFQALREDDNLFHHIDRARRETNLQLKRWDAIEPRQFHGDWLASDRECRSGFLKGKNSMLGLLAHSRT